MWRRAGSALRFSIGPRLLLMVPRRWAHSIARHLARILYARRRSALGERSRAIQARLGAAPEDVDSWLERAYELGASEQLDVSEHERLTRETFDDVIEVHGLERLQGALEAGKGAILYSGHVYGIMTFFVALAVRGFRLNMTTLPEGREDLSSQRFKRRRFEYWTTQLGIRPLRIESDNFGVAVQAINALRRNEIVTIVIDQSRSRLQTEVEFLGRRESFPSGPALIALTSGAPLVPFWINRTEQWSPAIAEIGEPHFAGGDPERTIQACAAWLEERIVQDPSSWSLWLNPGCEISEHADG